MTLLCGLDLLKFLDNTHPQPTATTPAAECIRWFRQDQLLLHAILTSMSSTVSPYVSAARSSHEAWSTLERMFASQSRQRVIILKTKLSRETITRSPFIFMIALPILKLILLLSACLTLWPLPPLHSPLLVVGLIPRCFITTPASLIVPPPLLITATTLTLGAQAFG
ncbi:unnamed protein product [Linum trigynum]|uniref:Uncharacterized protein n=1 Tax=Linum trigynum TaxID=586398 RepID=A0AAV2EA71_9ROSI